MTRYIHGLAQSFKAAWRGFLMAFRGERTFQIMVAGALIVIALAVTLPLGMAERLTLLLLTGAVLVLELMNTMIERLVDLMKPRLSAYVRDVKDLMAAAVVVASFFALAISIIIFWPFVLVIIMGI